MASRASPQWYFESSQSPEAFHLTHIHILSVLTASQDRPNNIQLSWETSFLLYGLVLQNGSTWAIRIWFWCHSKNSGIKLTIASGETKPRATWGSWTTGHLRIIWNKGIPSLGEAGSPSRFFESIAKKNDTIGDGILQYHSILRTLYMKTYWS